MLLNDTLQEVGGTERHLSTLARGLSEAGVGVHIRTLVGGGEIYDRLARQGFGVDTLNVGRVYSPGGIRAARRFAVWLRTLVDPVLLTYHFGADLVGAAVGAVTGVPVVSSRRDAGHWKRRRHTVAYRVLNRQFSRIIVVACAVRDAIVRDEGVAPARIRVVYNGLEEIAFTGVDPGELAGLRHRCGIDPSSAVVGIVANLTAVKDHPTFLTAARLVVDGWPAVTFLVIGTGPLEQDLRRRVDALRLGGHVRFLGYQPDPRPFIGLMNVGVISSTSEGCSQALLEYMAQGKAAVATRVGGNAELVIDSETGLLVPPRHPEQLGAAVLSLLRDPRRCAGMGEQGRARARLLFTEARCVHDHIDVLGEAREASA